MTQGEGDFGGPWEFGVGFGGSRGLWGDGDPTFVPLDLEELGHAGEIFLVGLSHFLAACRFMILSPCGWLKAMLEAMPELCSQIVDLPL